MATNEKKTDPEDADGQSTVPKDWPGMPGRSEEHEPPEVDKAARVTQAQRDLERRMHRAKK